MWCPMRYWNNVIREVEIELQTINNIPTKTFEKEYYTGYCFGKERYMRCLEKIETGLVCLKHLNQKENIIREIKYKKYLKDSHINK